MEDFQNSTRVLIAEKRAGHQAGRCCCYKALCNLCKVPSIVSICGYLHTLKRKACQERCKQPIQCFFFLSVVHVKIKQLIPPHLQKYARIGLQVCTFSPRQSLPKVAISHTRGKNHHILLFGAQALNKEIVHPYKNPLSLVPQSAFTVPMCGNLVKSSVVENLQRYTQGALLQNLGALLSMLMILFKARVM